MECGTNPQMGLANLCFSVSFEKLSINELNTLKASYYGNEMKSCFSEKVSLNE
jgi:hypothetical protein